MARHVVPVPDVSDKAYVPTMALDVDDELFLTAHLGLNWLKIRAYVALFTFELGPPHIEGRALGGFSEEMSPKTCTSIEREVI